MVTQLVRSAITIYALITVITGVLYPLTVTGIAQVLFPYQANGSIIVRQGKVVGSELIGQNFSDPKYFHPRPSAAGEYGYDAESSSGSNGGPTNQALMASWQSRAQAFRQENGLSDTEPIPPDVITASASGLDPHLSPKGALLQARRVAQARGLSESWVRDLVMAHAEPRVLGVLGEPTVNVLKLNLALDAN